MIQDIIVVLLFIAAVFYTGRLLIRSFQGKTGSASGCAKCNVADLAKPKKQLHTKA